MNQPRACILIVDDEEAILETMAFTFEDDYDVLTATSARQALQILADRSPIAAVITDQRMPEMTGVEFLARVYEQHPNTTRIILTGYADGDAMVRAINEGHVYAYVTKPWEPEELKQLVHRAVELHRLRVQNDLLVEDLQRANVFLAAAIDEIPIGALVIDASGTVRATNRPGREYLGLREDPSGQPLEKVLGADALREVRDVSRRLGVGVCDDARGAAPTYEELDVVTAGVSLRLRVAVRTLSEPGQGTLGRVILMREISHEPLRRHFEDILQEIRSNDGGLRPRLEQALQELEEFATKVRQSGITSAGMAELSERISQTRTAIEHWLAVDEALAREGYPDARLLVERMRIASSRWPLPEGIPERVRLLGERVEAYYESGENPGQHIL
ncbi:response regulator [Myxococcota bacterium]|nr:response regulator [Myxococcota bacterium]MCZ7617542.1 response regulator [Myxococcota bacterium]